MKWVENWFGNRIEIRKMVEKLLPVLIAAYNQARNNAQNQYLASRLFYLEERGWWPWILKARSLSILGPGGLPWNERHGHQLSWVWDTGHVAIHWISRRYMEWEFAARAVINILATWVIRIRCLVQGVIVWCESQAIVLYLLSAPTIWCRDRYIAHNSSACITRIKRQASIRV